MKKVNKITIIKELSPYIKNTPIGFKFFTINKFRKEKPHWFNEQIRINSAFPPYPSISFDRIVDIIKHQKRLPHTIDFAITSICPYKCPYCSYGKRKQEELPKNQILKLITKIKELGTAILGITGGEPMIRKDLEEIISASSPELTTIIYSTGFNFNKKRAEKFYNANLGSMIIGIDSTNPNIQDKIRGKKGSLQLGINALKICNKTGIYSAINTMATREKLYNGELERIYELADDLNVGELRLVFPIATGRWSDSSNEQLKIDELNLLKDIQKKLHKIRSGPIVTTLAEYESEGFMGCNTGYQTLFIDATGEVCPCDFTPLSFGNIQEKPLRDIWDDMKPYFPRPRSDCLMREICNNIDSDSFPLSPSDSKKMIPHLDNKSPYPKIYKCTKKVNK